METRAQRKRRENALVAPDNEMRQLKVVLKRLSKKDLQTHGVSIDNILYIFSISYYHYKSIYSN